ncbi:MAG: hypothetical protein P4L30_01810 [Candidatus Limnocylindrales bacterium]|nr:hypothetical protein [Candidatus Limnocylindrales bacterium]
MTRSMRVILEIGRAPRRIVAGAMDWPGLDRWGKSEPAAVAVLRTYVDRYAPVARRAGLDAGFAKEAGTVEVVERVAGSTSTDFWGVAHVPSQIEHEPLSTDELERRLVLLAACWAYFDDTVERVSGELRPGARSAGRTREQIVRHVYATEPEQLTRKIEVRTPREAVLTPDGLDLHRRRTLDAIREYHREGRQARAWPLPFLIRRIAHHVVDHAWELEDRDPTQ